MLFVRALYSLIGALSERIEPQIEDQHVHFPLELPYVSRFEPNLQSSGAQLCFSGLVIPVEYAQLHQI